MSLRRKHLRQRMRPTSGGSGSVPYSIATLRADYDADTLRATLSDAAAVTTWADDTGNGNDIGNTGSNRPTFDYTNPAFNGHASVNFAKASTQYLFGSSIPLCTELQGTDVYWTIFVVYRRSTKVTAQETFVSLGKSDSAVNYQQARWVYANSNSERPGASLRDGDGAADSSFQGLNEIVDLSTQIAVVTRDASGIAHHVVGHSQDPLYDATVDAINSTSGASYATQGAFTHDRFAIGALVRSTVSSPCEMEVARVLVYAGPLSQSQRVRISEHLWNTYAPRRISSPADLSGLSHWWDASVLAGSESSDVDTWEDLVGSMDFSASGFDSPVIALHENGNKVVSFDGVDDAMNADTAADANFLHNDSDFSLFIVYRVEASADQLVPLLDTNGGSTTDLGVSIAHDAASAAHSLQMKIGNGATNVINHDSQDYGVRPGAWHVAHVTHEAGTPSSEEEYQIWIDGENYCAINASNAQSASDATGPITLATLVSSIAEQPAWADGVSIGNRPVTTNWQENSGVCRSRLAANGSGDSGHLWHISDSPANRLMAQLLSDGSGQGEWTLTGASISDLEDIASATIGGVDYLYVADIGDNSNARSTFNIFRVVEPTITGSDSSTSNFEAIVCEYPGGDVPSHKDAETLFVDPDTGDMYVVTKRITPAKLYRLAHAASYTGTQTLEALGEIYTGPFTDDASGPTTGGYYVGGAINDDGTLIVLKNYQDIFVFTRDPATQTIAQALAETPAIVEGYVGGERPSSHPNNEPKGEGVCFLANNDLITTSEYNSTYGSASDAYPTFRYTKLAQAPVQVSFQEGVNGYSGTSDTYIWSNAANQGDDHGSDATFVVDYNSGTDERYGLLKFDLSSIPAGATIVGCDLYLNIDTEGQFFELYKMYQAWTESSSYTSLGGLPAFDDVDAASVPDASHGNYDTISGTGLFVQIKVPVATIQNWIDGTVANNGWVIYGTTNIDGLQFTSSEGVTSSDRPRLVVRYTLNAPIKVGEIIAYNRKLGRPGESQLVNEYLARKWNTSHVSVAAGNGLIALPDVEQHRAFPGLCRLASGFWILAYRRGQDHGSSAGVCCMKTSADGLDWSRERVIFDDSSNYDWRGVNFICQISTGRIFIGMTLSETDSSLLPYTSGVIYSDDDGATWSGPVFLSNATDSWFASIFGGELTYDEAVNSIVELADGTLLAHFMALVDTAVRPHIVQCRSTDGGTTWSEPEIVYYGRQPGLGDFPQDERIQEPCVVRFADGELLMAIRADTPNERIYFASSSDDGVTWSPSAFTTEFISGWGNPRMILDPNDSDGVFLFHRLDTSPNLAVWRHSSDRGATWTDPQPLTNLHDSATTTLPDYAGMTYAFPALDDDGNVWVALGLEDSDDGDVFVRRWQNLES